MQWPPRQNFLCKQDVQPEQEYMTAKGFQKSNKSVAHPERHFAVIGQQGHIKDKAVQELLQHRGAKVPAEYGKRDKSAAA